MVVRCQRVKLDSCGATYPEKKGVTFFNIRYYVFSVTLFRWHKLTNQSNFVWLQVAISYVIKHACKLLIKRISMLTVINLSTVRIFDTIAYEHF